MKKKVVSMLAVVLVLTPLSQVRAEFSDVSPEYPYYDAIMYVQEQGIVEGYSDGTFRPDNKINRAEFTKILVEAAVGTPEAEIAQNCFSDVNNQWFYVYVCFAKGKGWVGGYADGSFKPEQPINFAEAAKIIVNTMIAKTAAGDPWYKPYVDALYAKYAIPNTIGTFGDELTRGEMAEMIYRLKADVKVQSKSYDELDQADWLTYTSMAVPFRIQYPADYTAKTDTAETVNMDRQLQAVNFSKSKTCPPNYEGYCMEKYFTVRVFNNQGSQTLDQFVDLTERYDNWEIRAYDVKVDGQSAMLLYPSETELYARRFVFGHGSQLATDVYQYFFEIELSSGIDQELQYEILESFDNGQ